MSAKPRSDSSAIVDSLLDQAKSRQQKEAEASRIATEQERIASERKALRQRLEQAFRGAHDFPAEEKVLGRDTISDRFQRWAERLVAAGQIILECDESLPSLCLQERLRAVAAATISDDLKFACVLLSLAMEGRSDEMASALEKSDSDGKLRRFVLWLPYILDQLWHPYPNKQGIILIAAVPERTSLEEKEQAERAFGSDPCVAEETTEGDQPDANHGITAEETSTSGFPGGVDRDVFLAALLEEKSAGYGRVSELGRIVGEINRTDDDSQTDPDGVVAEPNPFTVGRRQWISILRKSISRIPELAGNLTEEKLRLWLWNNFKFRPTHDLHIDQLVSLLDHYKVEQAGKPHSPSQIPLGKRSPMPDVAKSNRFKKGGGRPKLATSNGEEARCKFTAYKRIERERLSGKKTRAILQELQGDRDFREMLQRHEITIDLKFIEAAFAYFRNNPDQRQNLSN